MNRESSQVLQYQEVVLLLFLLDKLSNYVEQGSASYSLWAGSGLQSHWIWSFEAFGSRILGMNCSGSQQCPSAHPPTQLWPCVDCSGLEPEKVARPWCGEWKASRFYKPVFRKALLEHGVGLGLKQIEISLKPSTIFLLPSLFWYLLRNKFNTLIH